MVAVVLVVGSMIGSCQGDSDGGTQTTSVPDGTVTIRTAAMAFDPMTTNVTTGTTVQWVNGDGVFHTVTSGAGSASPDAGELFDGALGSGQTFTFVFRTPGTYSYFCRPHEGMNMRGTVTVTDNGGGTGGTGGGGGGTGGRGYD